MRAVVAIVYVTLFMSNSCDSCVNEIQEEVVSPDGKMKAVVFLTICKEREGTNGPSHPTHVSVIPVDEKTTSLLTNAVAISKQAPWIVTWEDSNCLRLVYDVDAKVSYLKTEMNDIKIKFKVVHRSLQ
jgi:hypothetical protein